LGRIERLLVVPDFPQWGTFDSGTGECHLHREEKSGDGDLLEFAANQALLNGGTVYELEPERMPDSKSLAAVFR